MADALLADLRALAEKWEADDRAHLNTSGQHLMGGAVLSCADHLRELLAKHAPEPEWRRR